MHAALQGALSAGASKVCLAALKQSLRCNVDMSILLSVQAIILGSDIPDMSRAVICTAAAALDRHEVRVSTTRL